MLRQPTPRHAGSVAAGCSAMCAPRRMTFAALFRAWRGPRYARFPLAGGCSLALFRDNGRRMARPSPLPPAPPSLAKSSRHHCNDACFERALCIDWAWRHPRGCCVVSRLLGRSLSPSTLPSHRCDKPPPLVSHTKPLCAVPRDRAPSSRRLGRRCASSTEHRRSTSLTRSS